GPPRDGGGADSDAGLYPGLQLLADEFGRLVEDKVLRETLERLPRRSHISEHRGPRLVAIVSRRLLLDTLEALNTRLTRRFPSAVSPTRPSRRRRRYGTSASSPTSTTASRRWAIGCCSSPASSMSGRCARSIWTGWTSNANAASPSRPKTSVSLGKWMARTMCCT